MSFSHWWFSCLLAPVDEQRFQPLFAEAEQKAGLSPSDEEALRYWETHVERFSSTWERSASLEERKQQGEWYNRFVCAFNLPGYTELAAEVTSVLSDDTCFRFVSISRCSPGAVLWQTIGRKRATLLPGNMGNVFLRAQEVAAALTHTESTMRGLILNEAIEKGLALAGHSNDEEQVRNVITHLPEGLHRAVESRMGFMALARPQL